MKIRLSQLRRIIREALEEQAWVPGRWYPGEGEPSTDNEVDRMGSGGLGDMDEDDVDQEVSHVHVGVDQ